MDPLLASFRNNLLSLIEDLRGSKLIAAVSGGKDSIALLTLLKSLEAELNFTVKAAYFNHHLRADSHLEEAWIIHFCETRGIPLILGGANVSEYAGKEKQNLEEAASHLRYTFLKPLAALPRTWILTGHTGSDLSETFLMHLFRGSGSTGLAAIHPLKWSRILRPLLSVTEPEIRAYLQRNGIPHYSDTSNLNNRFLRNRVRHKLMPTLRKEFPHLDRKVNDAVDILREESDFLRKLARETLDGMLLQKKILPTRRMYTLHPALQRHLLREYIRLLRGDLRGISLAHIDSLRLQRSPQRNLSIPGITFSLRKGFLFPVSFHIPEYDHPLPSTGTLDIPEIGAHVRTGSDTDAPHSREAVFSVCLDPARLSLPLRVRSACRSDRYRTVGSDVSKKIFEMIRVAGLPAPLRALRPIFCDAADRPFWIPGSPPASHAPQTRGQGLRITVEGLWAE